MDMSDPAPKRRWFRFSLRWLFVATALAAALSWAYIETREAEKFRAESERLQKEKAFLNTKIRTQEQLVHDIREVMRDVREGRRRPIPSDIPAHWREPPKDIPSR